MAFIKGHVYKVLGKRGLNLLLYNGKLDSCKVISITSNHIIWNQFCYVNRFSKKDYIEYDKEVYYAIVKTIDNFIATTINLVHDKILDITINSDNHIEYPTKGCFAGGVKQGNELIYCGFYNFIETDQFPLKEILLIERNTIRLEYSSDLMLNVGNGSVPPQVLHKAKYEFYKLITEIEKLTNESLESCYPYPFSGKHL